MKRSPYVSTTNACKLCRPLGACLAFRGIEGAVPLLHGSQGCATYMRRYIISHFREPMDIASSSLGEKHAVYGGGPNLKQAIKNVMTKFGAKVIGIATTCLTETIGDDVPGIVKESLKEIDSQRGGQGRCGADMHRPACGGHAQFAAGISLSGGPSASEGDHRRLLVSVSHSARFLPDPRWSRTR
jgi:hypothetical protein